MIAPRLSLLVAALSLAGGLAFPVGAQEDADRISFPMELEGDFGTIVLYQPQIESFEGDRLEARGVDPDEFQGDRKFTIEVGWRKFL